jgi:hypothetical protein
VALVHADSVREIAEKEENSVFRTWAQDLEARIAYARDRKLEEIAGRKGFYFRDYWGWMTDICIPRAWELGRLYQAEGLGDSSLHYFGQILQQKYPWRNGAFYPRSVFETARIFELGGNEKRAAEFYTRFLGLWQEADGTIKEVAEARRSLADLQNRNIQ